MFEGSRLGIQVSRAWPCLYAVLLKILLVGQEPSIVSVAN
jgi:hypothetical protein